MGAFEKLYEATGLKGDFADLLLVATLILTRIAPITFLTPFLGGKLVPPETRIGISVLLTILIYPFASSAMDGPITRSEGIYLALMLKEAFLGFVIGFLAALLFYAMEIAGRALDLMRGSNMAEMQVPELELRASPFGEMMFHFLLVVFCALNGHGYFLESVAESFRIAPVDRWPTVSLGFVGLVDEILRYSNDLFKLAFALVFPGILAAFVVDIVFGLFNRIAPQLNAYFMAMPVKAIAGIALFLFSLRLVIEELVKHLEHALVFGRQIVERFG